MTAPELKPCPFCGGEAEAINYVIEAAVRCMNCRCAITRRHPPHNDDGYDEAITAWNTRHKPLSEKLFDQQVSDYVRKGKAMTAPELKPCPFCGGEARAWAAQIMVDGDCPESIGCPNENCQVSISTGYMPFNEAVAAWNTRSDLHDATKAQLAKAVDALRDLVTCVDDGCICSEAKMAASMDNARAVLAEIEKGGV